MRISLLTVALISMVALSLWLTGATGLIASPFSSPTPTSAPSPDMPIPSPEPAFAPSPEDQAKLIDQKAEAARLAGINYVPETPNELTFPQPLNSEVRKVRLTRQDIQAAFEQSLTTMRDQFEAIAEEQGTDAALAVEEELRRQAEEAQAAIPEEGLDLEVPAIELGTGSISWSKYTYSGGNATDPVNLVFGGPQGSDWDVNYDLKNWTTLRWHDDGDGGYGFACISKQQIYVWDAVHGGSNSWRDNSYGLQPSWDSCSPLFNPQARFHIRIFPGGYDNHPGGFQEYSFGAAHFESTGHTPKSWEAAESLVQLSFRNTDGSLLWFVGNIYYQQMYSQGTWRGLADNGIVTIIMLNF